MINTVKDSVLNICKNSTDTQITFEEVVNATGLSEPDVDKALRQLEKSGFIENVLYADDVPAIFYLR
jgi:DNA-binding transcriptional regulator GbsR (MarR family)